MRADMSAVRDIALQFAQAIAQRDYGRAYALTTLDYQRHTSLTEVQGELERIIPNDWGPIEAVPVDIEVLEDWPDKQMDDVGWVYVSLEGDVYPYSEGLFILISQEGGTLKVRDVIFGRP